MIKRSLRILLLPLLLIMLMTTACERRPLEVIVDEAVRVKLVVRWQVNFVELYGEQPNGMTVMLWGSNATQPIVETTNEDQIILSLKPDTYRIAIFNELMSDYQPQIQFFDADDYDKIAARTVAMTRGGWDDGATYMYTMADDPRMAVALDTFTITRDMVEQDSLLFVPYEEYIEGKYDDERVYVHTYEIPETPWPMTVDLTVKVKVQRRQSIRTVEASLSGLADGFYLSHVNRTTETGTILFDPARWEKHKIREEADSMGLLSIKVPVFGMPYGKELLSERKETDNVLTFHFTLVDDRTVDLSYDVGKQILYITPEGREAQIRYRQDLQNLKLELDLHEVLVLPPAESNTGAGFDAEVDEWDDGGAFDVNF